MSETRQNVDLFMHDDVHMIMHKAKNLFLSMKPQFLTAAVIPVLAGTSFSFTQTASLQLLNFLLALAGIIFLHISGNMFNDYFDHLNGTDGINEEFVKPFTGGSRVIQDGIMEPYQILLWAAVFLFAGSAVGGVLVYRTGIKLMYIGFIGFLSIIFYVNRNFSLAATGLGEITIFLNFGLLPVLGAYYVQTREISMGAVLFSLPIGLFITAVLYINQFPDFAADKKTGKRTIIVRAGRKWARWGYILLLASAYGTTAVLILMKIVPLPAAAVFLTLPAALWSCSLLFKFYNDSKKLAPALAVTVFLHLTVGYLLIISLLCGNSQSPAFYALLLPGLIFLGIKLNSLYKSTKVPCIRESGGLHA